MARIKEVGNNEIELREKLEKERGINNSKRTKVLKEGRDIVIKI